MLFSRDAVMIRIGQCRGDCGNTPKQRRKRAVGGRYLAQTLARMAGLMPGHFLSTTQGVAVASAPPTRQAAGPRYRLHNRLVTGAREGLSSRLVKTGVDETDGDTGCIASVAVYI